MSPHAMAAYGESVAVSLIPLSQYTHTYMKKLLMDIERDITELRQLEHEYASVMKKIMECEIELSRYMK